MKTLLSIIGGISAALLAASPALAQNGDADTAYVILLVLGLIFLLIYFIPTMVAFNRRHANRWAIFVVNIVFGGTGIGWLGSLIWACVQCIAATAAVTAAKAASTCS